MRSNAVREAFARHAVAVNGWVSSDSAYAAETLSYCGFDCVTVDMQHGMFGTDGALRLVQAVSAGPAMPMVRVPALDAALIGKLLDAGAYGVICPSVDTAAQAAAFVAACRYPPLGSRSFGPSRGLLYGGPDYVANADVTVLAWAMIESVAALDDLDAIVATPGLDGVYVGPNDLALSMGAQPGTARPSSAVAAAMERVRVVAADAGLFTGLFCADAAMAAEMAARGWNLVTPGNDVAILRQAAVQRVLETRTGRPVAAGSVEAPSGQAGSGGY